MIKLNENWSVKNITTSKNYSIIDNSGNRRYLTADDLKFQISLTNGIIPKGLTPGCKIHVSVIKESKIVTLATGMRGVQITYTSGRVRVIKSSPKAFEYSRNIKCKKITPNDDSNKYDILGKRLQPGSVIDGIKIISYIPRSMTSGVLTLEDADGNQLQISNTTFSAWKKKGMAEAFAKKLEVRARQKGRTVEKCLYDFWNKRRYNGDLCLEWLSDISTFKSWAYKNGYKEGMCILKYDKMSVSSPENSYVHDKTKTALSRANNKNCVQLRVFNRSHTKLEWCDILYLPLNARHDHYNELTLSELYKRYKGVELNIDIVDRLEKEWVERNK